MDIWVIPIQRGQTGEVERQHRTLLEERSFASTGSVSRPMHHRHATEGLERADAYLFGRVTYEMMEAAFRRPAGTGALGLIDEYEFVVHPRIAGYGPSLFAGLSKHVALKLVDRLELASGAVALRYEPRR